MIIVYPILVSRAVSDKAIPVIAKALELYLIVHKQDEILRRTKVFVGRVSEQDRPYQPGNKKRDAIDLRRQLPQPYEHKPEKDYIDADYEEVKDTKKSKEDNGKKIKLAAKNAEINVMKMKDLHTLSLQPTFITVKGIFGNHLVGVKVVPTRVRSDVKLSELVAHDISLRWLNAKLIKLGRTILRHVYQVSNKWKGETISGVPRHDLIFNRTGLKGHTFIVLSKNYDIDENTLNQASKIKRLISLGWNDLIIADDVNRIAYFCMKEFKGICSSISYASLYQHVGHMKVYDTIEAAEKNSGSLFRIKKPLVTAISEHDHTGDKNMQVLESYLQDISEQVLLELNIKRLVKVVSPFNKIAPILKRLYIKISKDKTDVVKSLQTVRKSLSFLPKVSYEDIKSYFEKKVPQFQKLHNKTFTILRNSVPDASDRKLDKAATFVVLKSFTKKQNENTTIDANLKKNIQTLVFKIRKFIDENEEQRKKKKLTKEELADLAVAWAVVVSSLVLTLALGAGLYTVFSSISTWMIPLTVLAAVTFLIFTAIKSED